jgi:hypothetical protein
MLQRQAAARLAADGPQYRVVFFFEFFDSDVAADTRSHARIDMPHFEDTVDFMIEESARGAVTGNAVAEHAAEFVMLVEDGAGDTLAPQLVGCRQAGRPAADNCNPVLTHRGQVAELEAAAPGGVADKLLDRVDADEVVNVVAIAALFAGRRANPPHHRRKRIGVGRAPEGVFFHAHAFGRQLDAAHDVEPAADVFTGRAAALTGRRAMHVGWALVRSIFVKDIVALRTPAIRTILVFPECEFLVHFLF